MRTIIAGSRTITDYKIIKNGMFEILINPSVIISGTANGVDKLGEMWAKDNNIEVIRFPANWNLYGISAGHLRNIQMVEEGKAEAAIIFWDGISKGTQDMIRIAKNHKLFLKVFKI